MAKLVLLLVLVCFQFSFQEELENPEFETPVNIQLLDGEDKNQWYYHYKPLEGELENEKEEDKLEYEEEDKLEYEEEYYVYEDYDSAEEEEQWLELLEELLSENCKQDELIKKFRKLKELLQEKKRNYDISLDETANGHRTDVPSVTGDPIEQREGNNSEIIHNLLHSVREMNRKKRQISKRFSSV